LPLPKHYGKGLRHINIVVRTNRDHIANDTVIKERAIKRRELKTKLLRQSLSLEDNPAKLVNEYLHRENDLFNSNFVVFAQDMWLIAKMCPDKLLLMFTSLRARNDVI
jgi:hypothetical protein